MVISSGGGLLNPTSDRMGSRRLTLVRIGEWLGSVDFVVVRGLMGM